MDNNADSTEAGQDGISEPEQSGSRNTGGGSTKPFSKIIEVVQSLFKPEFMQGQSDIDERSFQREFVQVFTKLGLDIEVEDFDDNTLGGKELKQHLEALSRDRLKRRLKGAEKGRGKRSFRKRVVKHNHSDSDCTGTDSDCDIPFRPLRTIGRNNDPSKLCSDLNNVMEGGGIPAVSERPIPGIGLPIPGIGSLFWYRYRYRFLKKISADTDTCIGIGLPIPIPIYRYRYHRYRWYRYRWYRPILVCGLTRMHINRSFKFLHGVLASIAHRQRAGSWGQSQAGRPGWLEFDSPREKIELFPFLVFICIP